MYNRNNIDRLSKTANRIEDKVEYLIERMELKEGYDKRIELRKKEEKEKRLKRAKENSKDKKLVDEAKKFFYRNRKKIPEDRLVLYVKNRKARWVLI